EALRQREDDDWEFERRAHVIREARAELQRARRIRLDAEHIRLLIEGEIARRAELERLAQIERERLATSARRARLIQERLEGVAERQRQREAARLRRVRQNAEPD